MTATTFNANLGDIKDAIDIQAGGTPGARCMTLIIDWSKTGPDLGGQLEAVNAIGRIAALVRERFATLPQA